MGPDKEVFGVYLNHQDKVESNVKIVEHNDTYVITGVVSRAQD